MPFALKRYFNYGQEDNTEHTHVGFEFAVGIL